MPKVGGYGEEFHSPKASIPLRPRNTCSFASRLVGPLRRAISSTVHAARKPKKSTYQLEL
ncbi:MAG: hypothetical protein ABSC20_12165 [Candidatus Bathyarchaeia archaeon]|jgi:hypothetical protein